MLARIWSGVARTDSIEAYLTHLRTATFPALASLPTASVLPAFSFQRVSCCRRTRSAPLHEETMRAGRRE